MPQTDSDRNDGTGRTAVTIKAVNGGPLQIKGPVEVLDHDGRRIDTGGRKTVFLCRCGRSAALPFCDGAHARTPPAPA